MKVVLVDNFDTELISDVLVCENVGEYFANKIAKALNAQENEMSPNYYVVKPDDYVLFKKEY